MITSSKPDSWQELQREVGLILKQCGFSVEIEKKMQTVRGEVQLDVYAEEVVKGRRYSIACECKHWSRRVPQSVIHSFRTVVHDSGINIGYIISLNGFQSGSIDASALTNIELVTWEGFQDAFCQSWLEQYFSPTITRELDKLLSYTEPLVPTWFCEVPDDDKEILRGLREKYMEFGWLVMMFAPYSCWLKSQGFPRLPLKDGLKGRSISGETIPQSILEARGYREFLKQALAFGTGAIREFEEVKDRYKPRDARK